MLQTRIPRPQGLTQILQVFHTNKEEYRINVIQAVIRNYIQNNYSYNGEYLTFAELAQLLKVPYSVLQTMINEYIQLNDLHTNPETDKAFARDGFLKAFFLGLEAAHEARKQLSTLRLSQGDTYQPFISSEVNKAIKNLMDGAKTVADLAVNIAPKTTAINVLNQGAHVTVNNQILGPAEAQALLEDNLKSMNFVIGSEAHLATLSQSSSLRAQVLIPVEATAEIEATVENQALRKRAQEEDEYTDAEIRDIRKQHQDMGLND